MAQEVLARFLTLISHRVFHMALGQRCPKLWVTVALALVDFWVIL